MLFDRLKHIGWIGVDIFFCLSAFLLTRLLTREINQNSTINIKHFFIRRLLRIWPLYFTYIIIAIAFSIYTGITNDNWFRTIGLLSFTENIFAAFCQYNPIWFTGHLWTISYEEQFYLILPFLIPLLVRVTKAKRNGLLFAIFCAGSLCRIILIYCKVKQPAIWVLPITHFESILAGIFLAFISPPDKNRKNLSLYSFIIGALIFCIILYLPDTGVTGYHLMLLYPCIGITTGCIVVAAITNKNNFVRSVLTNSIFVFLGKISFGLYVLHIASINMVDYILRQFDIAMPILTTIISFMVTIILSVLSYLLLETRFLKMKENFTAIASRPV